MSDTAVEQAEQVRHRTIEIAVNNRPVRVEDKRLTGLEIKQAAIAQGVPIQLDFLLSEQLGHGQTRIVGDTDEIKVNIHSKFTAVAGDDNS
ncbi:MAG: multiubiquitin domain-containing protein [Pseudonocardiaceae bacterium]